MKLDNVGQEIGRRDLRLHGPLTVTVVIGVPQQDGPDFFCPYQILGIGSEKVGYAYGVDALQALQLTLKKIGTDLYTSNEYKIGALSWVGKSNSGDLGFPVPDVLKDLLP